MLFHEVCYVICAVIFTNKVLLRECRDDPDVRGQDGRRPSPEYQERKPSKNYLFALFLTLKLFHITVGAAMLVK